MHRALPPPFFEIKKCVYRYDFIVTARRGNNIFAVLSSPCGAETILLPFYRHRAAREQYFCRFIVTVRRGNNIFAILSSPCGAETIFVPFYRRRAARKQYFCRFIVTARRGSNISPNPLILMFARAPSCCFKLLCMLSFLCALCRNDR